MTRLRTGAERRDTRDRAGAGAAPARRAGNASRAVRAAPRRARQVGGPFGGRYRLLDWLDSGGMAAVYRARDERLRREVAIKVIAEHLGRDPQFVSRFRREAQLGRQFAHPNADFGLAAGCGEAPAPPTEIVTGTPGYVAPEVLWGALPTPRSDLYSLGVAAYRLLAGSSGARPRDAQSTAPMATAAPRMPPLGKLCPDLPRGLTDAVQRAMASDPARRQRSVLEFAAALTA